MSDKIKISWDEVNSKAVDEKLKRQSAVGRADEHYRERASAPSNEPFVWSKLLYNSLVFMGAFGFAGGLVGWMFGEIILTVVSDRREEFHEFQIEAAAIQNEMFLESSSEDEMFANPEFELRMQRLVRKYSGNVYIQALTDPTLDEFTADARLEELSEWDERRSFIQQMIWMAWLAMTVSLALSVGDQVVSRNMSGAIVSGSIGIVLGAGGGLLVSLFINQLYTALLGEGTAEDIPQARQVLARTVGWAILGAFLAVAPGIVLKNTKRMVIGIAGGILGGAVGGLMFDRIVVWTESDVLSRFVGIAAIGITAAVGTGVIETVAKTGWLRVVSGLIAGKQFILYKSPTYIGSSPDCEIYLFKDFEVHPRHAAIRRLPGGFEIEDLTNGKTTVNGARISRARLANGDQIQIGSTVFQFQARGRNK